MATGCQGPFVNGTGGWCGCNCKCCPPADMVTCVSAKFGPPPVTSLAAAEEITAPQQYDLRLPDPPQEMPSFDNTPILSEDKRFLFGGPAQTCSVPCNTIDIHLIPNTTTPVCGFQVHNCVIKAVGNGYVTTVPKQITVPNCGTIKVKVNGQYPPVYVTDGSIITVSLEYETPWNTVCCLCVDICPVSCMSAMSIVKNLLTIKTKDGKIRIDPETGRPIVVIKKADLLKRVIERRQRLRRKK